MSGFDEKGRMGMVVEMKNFNGEGEMEENVKAKIIAKAWKDVAFRDKLINNPKEALLEFGITVPEAVEFSVLQDNPNNVHFVLPNPPSQIHELQENELEKLAAAGDPGATCDPCTPLRYFITT